MGNEQEDEKNFYLSDMIVKLLLLFNKISEHFQFPFYSYVISSNSETLLYDKKKKKKKIQSVLLPSFAQGVFTHNAMCYMQFTSCFWIAWSGSSECHCTSTPSKPKYDNFPRHKSRIWMKHSWSVRTTHWVPPHLQREFEDKVGNGLTELSTSREVGLTSTCDYVWRLDAKTDPRTCARTQNLNIFDVHLIRKYRF